MKAKIFLLPMIVIFGVLASCSQNSEINTNNTTENISATQNVISSQKIILNNESIVISQAWEYEISGQISNGNIIVNIPENATANLKFSWIHIHNETGSAIVVQSGNVNIELVDGTQNILSDGNAYSDTSENSPDATLYASGDIKIFGNGNLTLNSSFNDAIIAKNTLTIDAGNIVINAENNALHAEKNITINNGKIDIQKSVEWIESEKVLIAGGEIFITSSDDGINASSSSATSSSGFSVADENLFIRITGGNITINSGTDGIDSNGNIELEGGNVVIYGPETGWDGALDYDGNFNISGGTIIAFGMVDMAQNASQNSSQNSLLINLDSVYSASKIFTIRDENENIILQQKSLKNFQSIMISWPFFEIWKKYFYDIDGENIGNFTLSQNIFNIGNVGRFGGWMPPNMPMPNFRPQN